MINPITKHIVPIFCLLMFVNLNALAFQEYNDYELTEELVPVQEGIWTWQYTIADQLGSKLVYTGKLTSVFADNKLVSQSIQDTLLLDRLGSNNVLLTFVGSQRPQIHIMQMRNKSEILQSPILRIDQPISIFSSFFITFWLIFVAIIKWNQSRDLEDYIRIDRIFSPRNTDENILRNKLLTASNLLFLFLLITTVSAIIVLGSEWENPSGEGFTFLMGSWLKWIAISTLIVLIKWGLIEVFSYVFNIPAFVQLHLINLLRISLFFASFWLIVLFFSIWNGYFIGENQWLLNGVFISLGLGTLVLFLKLINAEHYHQFHLFSYICATEVIPFFGMVLIFSQ